MTNSQLSKEFTKLYPELNLYGSKAINAIRSNVDITTLMSELYLHLYKDKDKITSISDLEAFSKNWMKSNLNWKNSPLNRLVNPRDSHVPIEYAEHVPAYVITMGIFVEEKIDEFVGSLNSYDKRLWSIYYEKQLTTGKQIGEHLDMSISTGYVVLRECKQLVQEFKRQIHLTI